MIKQVIHTSVFFSLRKKNEQGAEEMIDLTPKEKSLIDQGFDALRRGDLEKAFSVMDKVLEDDPYSSEGYWGRGLCRERAAMDAEQVRQAIADYSQCIVCSTEERYAPLGRRGILRFRVGEYEQALEDLDRCLEINSYWPEALFFRGRTRLALARTPQELEQAAGDFEAALKHDDAPFAEGFYWHAHALRLLHRETEALADYREALACNPQHVYSLNALAFCLEHGLGCEPDPESAVELYTRAADLGDAEAQNLFALQLLRGEGVEEDPQRAVSCLQSAAEQDFPPALCNLAECYESGIGVQPDRTRSFALYGRAAELGHASGRFNVGRYYYYGIAVPEDNDKAFAVLKPLADEGHAGAQAIIGQCYERGYGTSVDQKLAQKYFLSAYKQNNSLAAYHLGARYRAGRGVSKNLNSAARYYREAGERGYSKGYFSLGRMYFDSGKFEKAAEGFRLAIDAGEKDTRDWLARALMRVKNPKPHLKEIAALLEESIARWEDPLYCALVLRVLEFFGFCGYPTDHEAAVRRVRRLLPREGEERPRNLSCAYGFLGQAYELGLGVGRDEEEAARYYQLAEEVHHDGCRCFLGNSAHLLLTGFDGGLKDEARARALIEAEIHQYDTKSNEKTIFLYLWLQLREEDPDLGELERLAQSVLEDDPNDVRAAYYMVLIRSRGRQPDAEAWRKRTEKLCKIASPYYAYMVRRQLETAPEIPAYPILTACLIDEYYDKRV